MDGLPPNYSGQYRNAPPPDRYPDNYQNNHEEEREERKEEKREEKKEEFERPGEKRGGSLLGNLFGGHRDRDKDEKDGRKGGLLSGFFNRGDKKDGGLFSHIEIEDLILIAVIFFLLKDGFEDDLILILAIILFST
jgi:hypothetical protein